MEKLNSKINSLFFHMGPGFHARVENQEFGAKYPHVLFLDQPLNLSFSELTDWACAQVSELSRKQQGPLKLLGHSFGAQLIAEITSRIPSAVAEVRLINSAFDPFDCFANLELLLKPGSATGATFWRTQTAENKLKLIIELSQMPGLSDAYWQNKEAQKNYEKIASQYPSLDAGSFVKTFLSFLNDQEQLKRVAWQGKSEIFYSKDDNLIKDLHCVLKWKTLYPQAQFIEGSGLGHYSFFESPELAEQFFSI